MEKKERWLYWMMVSLAVVLTVGIWQLPHPYSHRLLFPFTLLATWVHEMGHGLMGALLTRFEDLKIFADGGGVARTGGGGRIASALIAASGLLGPSIAGAGIIIFGRKEKNAKAVLWILAGAMALSVLIYVRNLFGILAISGWAVAIGLAAYFAKPRFCYFFVQLLGVQFCLNNFKDFNYMFTEGFRRDGAYMVSDSGQIAKSLFLPYWFWGGLVAGLSILFLVGSLWIAYKSDQASPQKTQ